MEDKTVACRKCQECIQARKRHWIGRLLAENQTAHSVWFVTLTYGGGYDNPDAAWLKFRHVQNMFKRLRKRGHKFKYVCVGEHGEEYDRGHWHALIYWQNEPPEGEFAKDRYHWEPWPHGTTYLEIPRSQEACAVYIMDYMNKDALIKAKMKYSKNPCIGHDYLIEYARKHARQGVALFQISDRFTIPNNNNRNGQPFYYPVGQETAMFDKMMHAYLEEWALCRFEEKLWLSPIMRDWLTDATQDASIFKTSIQRFLKHHYDIEPYEGGYYGMNQQKTVWTVQSGLQITYRDQIAVIEVYTPKGELTWQEALDGGRELVGEPPSLNQRVLRQLHRQLKGGPDRLRKLIDFGHLKSSIDAIYSPSAPAPDGTSADRGPPRSVEARAI